MIRLKLEDIEKQILAPQAQLSSATRGRPVPEDECELRPAFQRDRDRIIHSKAFRRLKHKTQVFLSPGGDHYRTRLTHTLEVAQIARTIAKSLFLNEDLTEAIALGHDLGHTPFGHAGEDVLQQIVPGGFRHPEQSLRVVDELEKLNLTHEVRDGILKHSKRGGPVLPDSPDVLPKTLEGQVVRVADSIAYLNHDLDDALRAKVITLEEFEAHDKGFARIFGTRHSQRIGRMVRDVIATTERNGVQRIAAGSEVIEGIMNLRRFLDERVYNGSVVFDDFTKSSKIIRELYQYYLDNEDVFNQETGNGFGSGSIERDVCDFISGMTDRYAFSAYEKIFLPQPWLIL
ncbi:MAG: deoxyguanosinetriphosphate triphosphohydrolase [Deltaproteobacteria bacterium]|nr:deoxyguanosinetriphosphate triphosphohydrolase [Deltaproteobacteria bacterium]